ncbi:MAG TPA: SpoIID/LytB domain-containing protein [Vicinamibacterales bacterium]|nr:SpoIID/LytB domain-containing protein [Vicinamibacterales bacterium]
MARKVLVLLAVVAAAACGPRPTPREAPGRPAAAVAVETIRVGISVEGRRQIVVVPLEEYALASALSEVAPPTGENAVMARVYQVQAVLARTYAIAHVRRHAKEGFDLCDGTHCQLVDLERPRRSRWANIARESVERTRGQVLYHAGVPASTFFHADCGGRRASAADVWGGRELAYLRGGADPLPGHRTHQAWRFAVGREKLRAALNATPRTAVGARLDTIDVQSRDQSGRARFLILNGERAPLVRGEEFRAAVAGALGPRTIRSSSFEVRRAGSVFHFEGRGFGHGVGLCQLGALARAEAGESAERILSFYFPGTSLRVTKRTAKSR